MGNLFRVGEKSKLLICTYRNPVYLWLRKWLKSQKTACWGMGRQKRLSLGRSLLLTVTQILQGQSFLSTACQINLKTENIHNPSQVQQFFKLPTSIFFCKLTSYFCGTDTRWGGERTRLHVNLKAFANTLYIYFPRKAAEFHMKQWTSSLETGPWETYKCNCGEFCQRPR